MPSIKEITTPDFGAATDVTVIEVLVKPGDEVKVDTPLVTLESDKATMELPSTAEGKVKEVKVKVGDKVQTGSPIVTLEAKGVEKEEKPEAQKKAAAEKEEKAQEQKESPEAQPSQEKSEKEKPQKEQAPLTGVLQSDSDIHAGPGVRRLARELGVNLGLVSGSGPKERILKEDVQLFVKTQLQRTEANVPMALSPMPVIDFSKFGPTSSQPLSRIKKISGKSLQRNWMMVPHVTQFGEADITELEKFRISQKKELEKQKVKLTPLVFVMKAVVASLKAFPHFNASLDTSGENLIIKAYFNLGVAVDTQEGLVVPVIRNVDKKGLIDLAKELAQVSERARNKQLLPADMQGGCFSISSLGGIGGTAFTPIVNVPEVAILGVSKAYYKPVYQAQNDDEEQGEFVPRLMLPLSLSYDHRVIDGADGARFIVYVTHMLSDIRNLLL